MKRKLLISSILGIGLGAFLNAQERASNNEEVYELSPFVVETEEDVGYLATNTLAGTRLSTKLKEVGAAVSVYTPEFLEDISATNIEEVLTYTASTEGGGVRGNFGGIEEDGSDELRVDPSGVNRVRSLAAATRTRGYIPTFIPGDSYNFSSLTVSRGPNAILAGIGAAGGVIDAGMSKANFKNSTNLRFRFDENGAHREELHWNHVLIDDTLAIRLDALNNNERYRQKQASRDDQRIYMAGLWNIRKNKKNVFLGNTSLRANVEIGSIEGTPPTNLPPLASLDGWFEDGPFDPDRADRFYPKWYHNGFDKSYYTSDGTKIAQLSNPGKFGNKVTPVPRGFPLYAQWAIVFGDPASAEAGVGITDPSASMLQGFQGTTRDGRGGFVASGDLAREQAKYGRGRLTDRNVFDYYNNLLTGNLDSMTQSFEAYDVRLEQLFMGGKAGVELVYNKQTDRRFRDLPIPTGGENYIYIDVNKTLTIGNDTFPDGIPNPNYGRPMVVTRDVFRQNEQFRESETYQATAFIQHDFRDSDAALLRWLGRHTLSGLLFESDFDKQIHGFSGTYSVEDGYLNSLQSTGSGPGLNLTTTNAIWYLGDSVENLTSVSQMRLNPISAARPSVDQEYYLGVWNRTNKVFDYGYTKPLIVLSDINDQLETVKSKSVALQSHWLKNHVITLIGWRDDESSTQTGLLPIEFEPEGGYDINKVTYIPSETQGKESVTKSIVVVYPESIMGELPFRADLRAYWNQSGNFQPVGQRRNFLNQEIGSPKAETEEYGVMLSMFDGKLDIRVNRFETKIEGQPVAVQNPSAYSFTMIKRMTDAHKAGLLNFEELEDFHRGEEELVNFDTFEDVARAFFEIIPEQLRENIGADKNFNPRFVGTGDSFDWIPENVIGKVSTANTVATGLEIEVVWNPNRNWRFAVNASKNEAVQADIAALELAYIDDYLENAETMFDGELLQFHRNPGSNEESWVDQYTFGQVKDVRNAAAASGTKNPEVRKWRVNALAFYNFTDGRFKGLSVGTAIRWQDEVAIGYPFIGPVADKDNPYYGPDQLSVDFNLRYKKKIRLFGQRVDWNIAFVLNNAFSDDELIPIQALPDGSINRARIPPDRRWQITTGFGF